MNFNMETDVASCAQCGELFVLSRLVKQTQWLQDLNSVPEPPPGVTYADAPGGWKISASLYNTTFFLIFAGAALLFLGLAVAVVSDNFFPPTAKANDTPFPLCFFGTLGLGALLACLLQAFGHIEVKDDQGKGSVFTGIGRIGLTRRFLWTRVVEVQEETPYQQNGVPMHRIFLVGADITFGSTLLQSRQRWIVDMLQRNLFRMHQKIAASKTPQPSKQADQ